jgi:hypothetical protein
MKNHRLAGTLLRGLCAFILVAACPVLHATTTINTPNQYAYGANIGWLNARGDVSQGAVIGQYFCTGYVWSANCGWICLGNGPTNGWRYSNESATDWGVNHDGAGSLSGYAFGANIGWVTFEQTNGLPRINLLTGIFSGYVWSGNVGWISLSNAQAFVQTDAFAPGPDSDGDGIPDPFEYRRTGDLVTLAGGTNDWDHDGATDTEEYRADTHPTHDLSLLEITEFGRDALSNTVSWITQPTRLYRLEASNAMPVGVSGGWQDVGGGLIGPLPNTTLDYSVPAPTSTTRFYRVKAILPLTASP